MKIAILDGKTVSPEEAVKHNEKFNVKGFIYKCTECGVNARVHRSSSSAHTNEAYFEHQNRQNAEHCSLAHY